MQSSRYLRLGRRMQRALRESSSGFLHPLVSCVSASVAFFAKERYQLLGDFLSRALTDAGTNGQVPEQSYWHHCFICLPALLANPLKCFVETDIGKSRYLIRVNLHVNQ